MSRKRLFLSTLCSGILAALFLLPLSAGAGGCPPVQYKVRQLAEGISYPQVTAGSNDRRIMERMNLFLRRHAEAVRQTDQNYKKQYAHDQQIGAAGPYYAYTRPVVRFNEGCLFSVSFIDEAYTGGAHGMHHETAYTFDTRGGRLYTLNDVVHGQKEQQKINAYLRRQMSDLKHKGRYDFFLDAFRGIDMEKGQFYFYKQGLVFIFQEYEIAPYSNGIIHLKVPYTAFRTERH